MIATKFSHDTHCYRKNWEFFNSTYGYFRNFLIFFELLSLINQSTTNLDHKRHLPEGSEHSPNKCIAIPWIPKSQSLIVNLREKTPPRALKHEWSCSPKHIQLISSQSWIFDIFSLLKVLHHFEIYNNLN